ncbi:hypothetical protein BCR33DRAFT_955 [Rhizoclosmatium globosum]|uniref:F-box domain-containing protein n=1 Tax=Rhizoclosmatium globosum TaxID=329046 RepID=A0A1Y2D2E5_9FUNG|nr:hypothetical protein BCR33DRAFT_955 [Rhizoclosmatium globosum]|eukprot:ORY53459.1 hypothetical protein BCR33DRAFT_955 [Rhizoclosmatium globosum]
MLRQNDPPINCLCSVQVANLNHQVSELERQLANALADINILRCLLKAPPVHRVEDALLPESSTRAKCAMLPSYTTSKPSLESLPGEILDKIASYIDRRSVKKLAHAVPYYKYISTAMFALVGYPSVNSSWPHFQLPEFRVSVQDYDISPSDQIFKVYTYCRVLQRNQGVVLLNVYPGLDLTYLAPFFTSSMELIFYFPKDRYDLMGKCVPLGTVLDALKVLKKCNVQRLNYLSFSAKDRNATLITNKQMIGPSLKIFL